MALDYNQKKQVSKNRPRKRPVKFLLLLILGSLFSIYGLGIATGWLVFKYLPQNTAASLADPSKLVKTDQVLPAPEPDTPKGGTAAQNKEPDLTFYYTLPKGEKGVIGSGINSLPPQPVPKTVPSATTAALNSKAPLEQKQIVEKKKTTESAVQQEKSPATTGANQSKVVTKDTGKATYTVQVAAYHAKTDAQELKVRLQKIGVSSRIEEFSVAGKGIWYRVRTGSKLDKETANRIAAKIGNNAMPVAE